MTISVIGRRALLQTSRGFTLWELMVVIALVVTLFVTAIENLLPMRGDAERAAVAATVGSLQSALGMESIRRAMTRGDEMLETMDGANPMDWLAVTPANYLGVIDGDLSSVPRGHWAFDVTQGILFYRVRYPQYFEGSFTRPSGLRFQVIAERGMDGKLGGIRLARLDSGAWTTDGSEFSRWLGDVQ